MATTGENAVATSDETAVEELVRAFFSAFTAGTDAAARLDDLRRIMIPGATVVRTCGLPVEVYDIESFIAPRLALLTSGEIEEFEEWPEPGRIDVFGDIAHWWGAYGKRWLAGGEVHTGRGMKTMSFVRTDDGWRISSAAWDDERQLKISR
ncbi:hypothetical protein SAMN05428985_103663 [Nocardioides sp. YR527]|uniref:DUF4440 domain-containing protein n=1 Tax=Nocardioides sp. YR527 TaxID=1881028 RepID=UPI000884BEF0|nr:DUF4440 domain-containing protein [Nocardioides sp. YR527]SDK34005.1 hypothetical protein SAMN05428985_103663 [Nocardioides sp. YR527]